MTHDWLKDFDLIHFLSRPKHLVQNDRHIFPRSISVSSKIKESLNLIAMFIMNWSWIQASFTQNTQFYHIKLQENL